MKKRLDVLLFEKGLAQSREKARSLILSGNVLVDDKPAFKCGEKYSPEASFRVKESSCFVSRGALKLIKALDFFNIDPSGMVCVDIGSSTGGFTEVLLKRGAKKVYAVDVGTNQLDFSLRRDERVVVMEKTNAKDLTLSLFADDLNLCVTDVSFISLTSVLKPAFEILKDKKIIALIKPQFEVGKEIKNFKGVVKNFDNRLKAVKRCIEYALTIGLFAKEIAYSPITGPKGNVEYLVYFTSDRFILDDEKIAESVKASCEELG
jgi:23S rRNA (cytidine1920-2'-O)/16S rRNA (cytidine1409-2'-O)-methyltransferase